MEGFEGGEDVAAVGAGDDPDRGNGRKDVRAARVGEVLAAFEGEGDELEESQAKKPKVRNAQFYRVLRKANDRLSSRVQGGLWDRQTGLLNGRQLEGSGFCIFLLVNAVCEREHGRAAANTADKRTCGSLGKCKLAHGLKSCHRTSS